MICSSSISRHRVSSNRLLESFPVQPTLMVYTMAYTDG